MANKIAVAGLINFLGTFLVKGIALVSIPVFTRMLTVEEYGLVSAYSSYVSFLLVVIGLSLNSSIQNARFDFEGRFGEFNFSISVASFVCFIAEAIVLNLLHGPVCDFLSISWGNMNIVLMIAFSQYTLSTFLKINTVDFRFRANVALSSLNAICNLGVSVILIIVLPDHVFARMVGQLSFMLFAAVGIYILLAKRSKLRFSISDVAYALRFAVPNIFHQLSMVVLNQFDRVAIIRFSGDVASGIYGVVFNFEMIIQMVFSALNEVWVPWLYRKLNAGEVESVVSWTKGYVATFSLGVVAVIMVSPELMMLLAPPEYAEGRYIVAPLVLSAYFVFLYSFYVNIEIYCKMNKYLAFGTVMAALLNIVGNIIFIQMYGYMAAAYTTLAAYVLLFVFHVFVATVVLKVSIYSVKIFLPWVILTCFSGVVLSFIIESVFLRLGALLLFVAAWAVVAKYQKIDLRDLVGRLMGK